MKINSKFKLFMQTDLSSSDFKVLTFLYQPLIGIEAYALYTTLYQLGRINNLISHHLVCDLLNVKQSVFIKNREKLEALGLLDSYQVNEEEYLYILKAPFSAKQFFLDTFLGTYLESEVGINNFEYLVNVFKIDKPITNHLTNITKDFEDLYQFDSTNLLNLSDDFEGRNGNSSKLIRKGINYEAFVEKLPRALKSANLLNENFKQKVIQLAFVYQYDIDQMVEIFINASKTRKHVTITQVNFEAKQYYERLNKDLIVNKVELDEFSAISSVSINSIVDKYVIDDPYQKGLALDTINTFISSNDIEVGVLNVMLMFILKNKNGILPTVGYLDKVWQSWSRNGVQTVEDAINYRNTLELTKSNYINSKTNNNKTKEVNKPDWLDEYLKEISEMEG